ncbi:MAG: DUF4446 family protein [Lachnospiraceae bacterium]|nr:DUF4446 family protein [Lachnospiraceae bacterium]
MNSNILKSIGLENLDPAVYIIVLIVMCIGLLIYNICLNKKINKLNNKYNNFLKGKNAESLEEVIYKRFDEVDRLIVADRVKNGQIEEIYNNLNIVYQKCGIVKYDAFNEMGGKLSFALCMLDKKNNGFVLNSMHSREGCYTYIKEIINGESAIELSENEKEALSNAVNQKM